MYISTVLMCPSVPCRNRRYVNKSHFICMYLTKDKAIKLVMMTLYYMTSIVQVYLPIKIDTMSMQPKIRNPGAPLPCKSISLPDFYYM